MNNEEREMWGRFAAVALNILIHDVGDQSARCKRAAEWADAMMVEWCKRFALTGKGGRDGV